MFIQIALLENQFTEPPFDCKNIRQDYGRCHGYLNT